MSRWKYEKNSMFMLSWNKKNVGNIVYLYGNKYQKVYFMSYKRLRGLRVFACQKSSMAFQYLSA